MKKVKFIFLIQVLLSCSNYMYDSKDLENILGVGIDTLSKEYAYEETSGIQGEGYLFNKYVLSDKAVSEFVKSKSKMSFPKKDKYKNDWELVHWQKGLILNNNVLNLLTVFEQHPNPSLKNELSELKNNLNVNDNYYSFFYKDSALEPYAIELYVLNPSNNTLWVINIIT